MADALERYLGEERAADGPRAPKAAAGVVAAGAAGAAAGLAAGSAGAAGAAGAGAAPGGRRRDRGRRPSEPRGANRVSAGCLRNRPALTDDPDDVEPGPRFGGPWLWISALLAIAILALAAFVVLKLTSGPGPSAAPQVQVPNFVGQTFDQAQAAATALGLMVQQVAFESSSATVGTVTKQDPAEGATVDKGSASS